MGGAPARICQSPRPGRRGGGALIHRRAHRSGYSNRSPSTISKSSDTSFGLSLAPVSALTRRISPSTSSSQIRWWSPEPDDVPFPTAMPALVPERPLVERAGPAVIHVDGVGEVERFGRKPAQLGVADGTRLHARGMGDRVDHRVESQRRRCDWFCVVAWIAEHAVDAVGPQEHRDGRGPEGFCVERLDQKGVAATVLEAMSNWPGPRS